jgi:hypothetical protein
MGEYGSDILDGTLRVTDAAKDLARRVSPKRDLTYTATAEVGVLDLQFARPYAGMKLQVEAVLDQEEEDFQLERALAMCAAVHAVRDACFALLRQS